MSDKPVSDLGITCCGNLEFRWGERTYVMGIVNVDPDSFSGDGLADIDTAVAQAKRFVDEGADIVDVGGESTRPGADPVSLEDEMKRVVPVIERLATELSVPVSVDTYKAEVAQQAVGVGASMVNDIWGLRKDPKLVKVVADTGVAVVITQNQRDNEFKDFFSDVMASLKQSIQIAVDAGIKRNNIIIDPGVGFGKTVEQNLELVRRLAELKALGHPILLGTSRKSFIGYTLDLPVEERLEGTAATVAIGIANGVDIVRVHDVKEMVRVTRMSDAVVRAKSD